MIGFILLLALPVIFAFFSALNSKQAPLLVSSSKGQWIEARRTFSLGTLPHSESWVFRREFRIPSTAGDISLSLQAFKRAVVYLDNAEIGRNRPEDWRTPHIIKLPGPVSSGTHEIKVSVTNEMGPALLKINSSFSDLDTDAQWLVSKDGQKWVLTEVIGRKARPDIVGKFPSAMQGVRHHLPLFAGIWLLMGLFWGIKRRWPALFCSYNPVVWLRWSLIVAWVVLAINNAPRLPFGVGYDQKQHLDYINYIFENHRLPLATEGWQMFQSPLYYMVSAAWWNTLSGFAENPVSSLIALRFVPLLCGLFQVELAYRAMRLVFPENTSAQMVGTLVGGLLPMNIYISQVWGNEPMAGVLSAGCLVYLLGLVNEPVFPPARRWMVLGCILGLALLAKVTAILLMPVALFGIIQMGAKQGIRLRTIAASACVVGLAAVGISGWYYLRNWILLGTPFMGGWNLPGPFSWWQDPGYRVMSDMFTFGEALRHPVYAATQGFWDSLYSTYWTDGGLSGVMNWEGRPPWNYEFLAACALLSVVPTLLIAIGMTAALKKESPFTLSTSFYAIAIYISALFSLYISLPIYSTGKATYTIGVTPCYAVLLAAGFVALYRQKWLKFPLLAVLGCWAVSSYCGFFIV